MGAVLVLIAVFRDVFTPERRGSWGVTPKNEVGISPLRLGVADIIAEWLKAQDGQRSP